jgi:hypothetical protein
VPKKKAREITQLIQLLRTRISGTGRATEVLVYKMTVAVAPPARGLALTIWTYYYSYEGRIQNSAVSFFLEDWHVA